LTFGAGHPVAWRHHGIVFVDTFVDAALHAATIGSVGSGHVGGRAKSGHNGGPLISRTGLRRVCLAAVADFRRLDAPNSAKGWRAHATATGNLAAMLGPHHRRAGNPFRRRSQCCPCHAVDRSAAGV
jgi:hypothetical protein